MNLQLEAQLILRSGDAPVNYLATPLSISAQHQQQWHHRTVHEPTSHRIAKNSGNILSTTTYVDGTPAAGPHEADPTHRSPTW